MWESDEEDDPMINFDPTDKELINDYLKKRIRNRWCGDDYVVDKDVYAKEPWLLDHYNKDNFFKEDEWFYFVTRTQVSDLKIGCGKKSKRKINDRGNWKANAKKYIIDEETRKIIGIKQTLTFNKSNKKKRKIGDGSSTCPGSDSSWIMKEYMLPEGDKFQELVLCKIKEKKKAKKKDDDHDHEASGFGEGSMAHRSEPATEQLKIDYQVHTNAPLGHDSSLPIQEAANEEEEGYIQYLLRSPNDQVHTNLPIQEAANEEEIQHSELDFFIDYYSSSTLWMDEGMPF